MHVFTILQHSHSSISDSDSSLSNCRKVESVKWSKVAKSEFVVSECSAYGTAHREVEEDQYDVVSDPAVPEYYVVPDPAVPEYYVVPDPAVPEYYVVPDPAVPEYLHVVPDPAVPEYLHVVPDAAVPEYYDIVVPDAAVPEYLYEVPDAVPKTINWPQETEEPVYECIPGDPQQ